MGKYLDQALVNSLTEVAYQEQVRHAMAFVVNSLGSDRSEHLRDAIATVEAEVWRHVSFANERALGMALAGRSESALKAGRRLAYRRFFDKMASLSSLLRCGPGGEYGGIWRVDEEAEFRAEIEGERASDEVKPDGD